MKRARAILLAVLASACATPERPSGLVPEVSAELARTGERKPAARPEALESALLPPIS